MDAPKYETPKIERLGTVRDLTRAGWTVAGGDAAHPFHRYGP